VCDNYSLYAEKIEYFTTNKNPVPKIFEPFKLAKYDKKKKKSNYKANELHERKLLLSLFFLIIAVNKQERQN